MSKRADPSGIHDRARNSKSGVTLHLITLTVEFLQRAISDNAEKIKAIELQLSTTGTPKELSTLKTEIQERIARHKKDIETRKRNKFARDAEDYKSNKVYRWQDNSRRTNIRQNHHTSSDLSTSGSGHEAGSSTTVSTLPFFRTAPIPHKKTRRGEKRKEKSGQLQDYPIEGMDNLVINISSRTLNVAEHSLLQKGLSFCPSYRCRTFDLDMDLQRFFWSVRLKAHFATIPPTTDTTPVDTNPKLLSSASLGLRNKSHFRPPQSHHAVETFIGFIKDSFISLKEDMGRGQLFYPPNLTIEERHSLKNLQEDRTIIIKPADKGGALVMMDKNKYVAEITRQLSDDSIYQPLDRDPLPGIRQKIETILHHYTVRGVVDQKTCEFLQNPNPITPVFYTLPKVHKNLENPPGRPHSGLHGLCTIPHSERSKSFLLDTGSFLDLIKVTKNIPVDSYLVTLDVKDLYTSIPHGDGIQSPRKLLDSTDRDIDQTSLCIDLLNVILTSNYFLFQDTFFLQKRGTAMGSHAAPPYANAYMIDFEESKIYPSPLFRDNVIIWKRYIDDIF
ncbi:unnamed protein product [Ranitomeya imitator]|uniref:Reverse transcriptase domain-containing protein n=1 Tax=Ranitomeya imitator TaxID=111125 RepID=A0ABN9M3I8_9NEOB|nr:unnamed protein product [Ranitomeya imitator]